MHSIYEGESVQKLHRLVGKVVRVSLSNKSSKNGTVFTIDPVSRCVALLEEETGCLCLLMGQAVVAVEELEGRAPSDLSRVLPSSGAASELGPEGGLAAVKSWLEKNRISVQEEGEGGALLIGGVVSLRAPYHPDLCTGDNELVVDRVRQVLQNIPSKQSV